MIVEDGSSEAHVYVEGDELVLTAVLALRPGEAQTIRVCHASACVSVLHDMLIDRCCTWQRHVADRGVVQYKRVGMGMRGDQDDKHDPALDKLILSPRIYRPVVLYCKPYFVVCIRSA